jgi:hypothetical protein
VTAEALESYVLAQVKTISDAGQSPHAQGPLPAAPGDLTRSDVLFHIKPATPTLMVAGTQVPVRLHAEGVPPAEARQLVAGLAGASLAASRVAADLTWVAADGSCIASSEIIASEVSTGSLQPVVDRMRAVVALKRLTAGQDSLRLRLLLQGERYEDPPRPDANACHSGTNLACVVDGLRLPHLAVVDLNGTGRIFTLFPQPGSTETTEAPVGRPYVLGGIYTKPPWGADHIVAVAAATPEPLRAIIRLDGELRPLALIEAIEKAAANGRIQVGIQAIFTCAT